jgi:hypothetical protein
VRSTEPGPLSNDERSLLDGLLNQDFPGVDALRLQVEWVHAKRGCECGCGTIELVITRDGLPRSEAASPAPVEGLIVEPGGNGVGGLILFLKDGYLASLEVYAYGIEPLPLPALETVDWVMINRQGPSMK